MLSHGLIEHCVGDGSGLWRGLKLLICSRLQVDDSMLGASCPLLRGRVG